MTNKFTSRKAKDVSTAAAKAFIKKKMQEIQRHLIFFHQ